MLTVVIGAVVGVAAFGGGWYTRGKYATQAQADIARLHSAITSLEATVKAAIGKAKSKVKL